LRKPDGSGLSQIHFLKDVFIVFTLDVIAEKILKKSLELFRHSERKRDGGGEKLTDFFNVFGRCDLVF